MDVTNVNGALGYAPPASSNDSVLGKDDFLKLLVTQLSYQDPLNPLEASDFSAQLAQFSSVEQLFNIEETLRASLDANYLLATSINNTMAATVIGKEVRAVGDSIYFDGESASGIISLPERMSLSGMEKITPELRKRKELTRFVLQRKMMLATPLRQAPTSRELSVDYAIVRPARCCCWATWKSACPMCMKFINREGDNNLDKKRPAFSLRAASAVRTVS